MRRVLTKIAWVSDLTWEEEQSLRLSIAQGGCGIISACTTQVFSHLASACQYMPAVEQFLLNLGWRRDQVEMAINWDGVHQCLSQLQNRQIYVDVDGNVHRVVVAHLLTTKSILWGKSRKIFRPLMDALQGDQCKALNDAYGRDRTIVAERQKARLKSCSGPAAGKWLDAFPSSWWPKFSDEAFVMALRFRGGIPVGRSGLGCQHERCNGEGPCGKSLDIYGDHCIVCGIGGHLFTRHGAVNNVLMEAGRSAGYAVLSEQVIPAFARVKVREDATCAITDGRIDVELFGHAYAPDHLLDGTVRHPGAASVVRVAAREVGHAAEEGAKVKRKRYPTKFGKAILPCSMETWGFLGKPLEALLEELLKPC